MRRILFVCTGNTCRSPMAEALLRKKADERGLFLEVKSAGVSALPGVAASSPAVEVLAEKGINNRDHRSQPMTKELLKWADLVLTMTRSHHQWLIHSYPEAVDKAHTLKEWVWKQEVGQEQRWQERDRLLVELETRRAMKARAQMDGDQERVVLFDRELRKIAERLEEISEGLNELQEDPDVVDPFGGDVDCYRQTAKEMEEWIERMIQLLLSDGQEQQE
ncbi:low molecular weight protein arginine phosphatase [Desmospora activa]|uniref:low molecular weight protein arginine phosphatase n=1 Tax=Desmospora activa TaxID=500615 RepID=UPI001472EBF6|nr:low molecular weight protein arginine phosphatase [Desmospora activa]